MQLQCDNIPASKLVFAEQFGAIYTDVHVLHSSISPMAVRTVDKAVEPEEEEYFLTSRERYDAEQYHYVIYVAC